MADIKDETFKFVSSIVPMLGAGIQLGTGLAKDLRRSGSVEKEIGSPGKWFFWIWRLPLFVANGVLSAVIILAFLSLFGGINRLSAWFTSPFARFCEKLFDESLWLIPAYFLLALFVYFRVLSRLAWLVARFYGWFRPDVKHDPGLINSDWVLSQDEEARFVNIDRNQCRIAASFVLQLPPEKTKTDFAGSACSNPKWSTGSRANALLIGCIIEGVIHDLPKGAKCKSINFGPFYSTLEKAGENIWKPKNIEAENAVQNILDALEKVDPLLGCLKLEPAIVDAMKKAIQRLRNNSLSDASALPERKWPSGLSLRRARRKLKAFPQMGEADRNPMDTQFLKLAIAAQVWPTLAPGPFIFPFSRGVSALLMNSNCFVTTHDAEAIAIDTNFQRLTAFAEQTITDSILELLRQSDKQATKSEFSNITDPWAVTRKVDYLLWWLSRQPNGWKLNLQALDQPPAQPDDSEDEKPRWKLSGNTLVRT